MGSSNRSIAFGPVISPGRSQGTPQPLVPGGSWVARPRRWLRMVCAGATPTDTGGSIRQPAALHRHSRHQADLWAVLALGRRHLCLLARPGRAHCPLGER